MKTALRYFFALLVMVSVNSVSAQVVTSVNYQMKYDTSTCLYDCYMIVNAGSATSAAARTQFNAQYSIVVPPGTSVAVDTSYMPLQGNLVSGSGTTPASWSISSVIAGCQGSDFYSIVPSLSPTARYNNLIVGDTVRLFSLDVSPTVNCAQDIKIFENGVDPDSSVPCMASSDFSNGFTMGGTNQLYSANSVQLYPPVPLIVDAATTCSNGIEIDLTATTSACQGPLTYQWSGPDGYNETDEDVSIPLADGDNNGIYKVTITDAFGCQDSIDITATGKPDAGADFTVCAGTANTLTGADPTTGTWSPLVVDPDFTLVNQSGGEAIVTFEDDADGDYTFIYAIPGCADTMVVTVDPKPEPTLDALAICVGDNTQANEAEVGTWTSSNPAVATVDLNTGLILGVSSGTTVITFENTATGCTADATTLTVNPAPTLSNTGTPDVCIGSTTQLNPQSGGFWLVDDNSIATVDILTGLVTGVSEGTATFTFTDGATGCTNTISVDVTATPTTTVSGDDEICINETTQLAPSTGGTWASSNTSIATINNTGLVTGVGAGTATFTWTDLSTGCASADSDPVTVNPNPTVAITGDDQLCNGKTSTLSPTIGGVWTSSDPAVLTVDPTTGAVTAVSQGFATFTWCDDVTGCCETTDPIIVDPAPFTSASDTDICIGGESTLFPGPSLGTWTAVDPATASLDGDGVTVTGVTPGTAAFIYAEASTGCLSDTMFITVDPGPSTNITGADELCVGESTTIVSIPAVTGVWESTNPAVASINNSGIIQALSPGTATFIFTDISSGCKSVPSAPVTVEESPVVSITGDPDICIGETTQLSPSTGGTWVSSNPGVAFVVATTGAVTGLSAGSATFTFTDNSTGCVSLATDPVTVNERPTVNFTGPDEVCIGENTTLAPTTGGTWESSNTAVAVVDNNGVVTAIAAGSVTFTFTLTGSGCPSNGLDATINPTPVVGITGDSDICIDETTQLSSTLSNGSWVSSDNSIATVTNAGVVTGVSAGSATFYYESEDGCPSDETNAIVVNAAPTVSLNATNICIDETTTLNASSAGTWVSLTPAIATVTAAGVVTGVSAGSVQFQFTSSVNDCVSPVTDFLTVEPRPTINISGPETICIGETTTIAPTIGGSWESTDPSIATVTNNGLITGIAPGEVRFIFTDLNSGCKSDTSDIVTVTDGPTVTIADLDLCIGESTTLTPAINGTWESSDLAVATVTNSGVVTAVGAGSVDFVFTDDGGCKSQPTPTLVVNPVPTIVLTGPNEVCIGATTTFTPSTGGTWTSNDPSIATITNAGLVTGVSTGTTTFYFEDSTTGCRSDDSQDISVALAPDVSIDGPTTICIGGSTTVTPTTGGIWTSSDPSIATVDNDGNVIGLSPGVVSFTFETLAGCAAPAPTGDLTITACADPDFNVTYVDIPVPGDVSTNDAVPTGITFTYGPTPVLTGSPGGSIQTLTMNSDGTYEFTGNTVGVYTYDVPYCIAPETAGCATAELTITVLDFLEPDLRPVANVDYATTALNTAVILATMENDKCVVTTGCSLDPTSVTVTMVPTKGGSAVPNPATGDMTYTPVAGFVGFDTLTYQVCVTGEPTNCATAHQIILVNSASTANSTQAADDFAVTPQGEQASGDVSINDSDAEGDGQTVTAYSVTVAEGTFTIAADGTFTFDPVPTFYGPVEFPYTTTDDNGTPATADATVHILVVRDLLIRVRVYLEGALMNNFLAKGDHGRPLMRDELRESPFTGARYIPDEDPYSIAATSATNGITNFMSLTPILANYQHTTMGARADFTNVTDPASVFAVTGQDAITDWVFVELRSKADSTTVLATRSGLVQRDGDVAEMDGLWGLRFPGIAIDDYYVVVRHRNHLGTMTAAPQTPTQLNELVDFSDINTGFYDFGPDKNIYDYDGLAQKYDFFNEVYMLWGGDFDTNKKVKYDNPNDDLNTLLFEVLGYPGNDLGNANFDFGYGYLNGDFDMNSKSKFDNPNDDKNSLFFQVFGYPLNLQGFSSFDFIIEQIPND